MVSRWQAPIVPIACHSSSNSNSSYCFYAGEDYCESFRDPAEAGGEATDEHSAMPVIVVGEREWLGGVENAEARACHGVRVADRFQLKCRDGLQQRRVAIRVMESNGL
jgi:hypothetical protein